MQVASDQYDLFVSYARGDNAAGWITHFIQELQEEHRRYSGGREFRIFFDTSEIRSLDDWRHRLYESLAASRLLVAFISPAYFSSEWCRREWNTWIDVEIAKHILSDGAAPIYIVEVPWLRQTMSEQQASEAIAKLCRRPADPSAARDAILLAEQIQRRQLTEVRSFYDLGLEALRREDLRRTLDKLAQDLSARAAQVEAASHSVSTIPLYNRRFVGRLDELRLLRERLHGGRTGVISGACEKGTVASVHGLGGIGKTELAYTYAHAFGGLYPGGRFLLQCEGHSDLRHAILKLDEFFHHQITDEQRQTIELHFFAIRNCLRRRIEEMGRALLILDNVTDASLLSAEQTDGIRVLGPNLHLLATTRLGAPEYRGAYDEVHWMTLGELNLGDSVALLEKHRPFADTAERIAAEAIGKRLGGFALCVEVVGAYLGQNPEETYAAFLERMGLSDLEQVDVTAESRNVTTRRHNNEKRLSATLAPTLASLSERERLTLSFAALLAPDHVVLPWLHELAGATASERFDETMWETVVSRLTALALFSRAEADGGQTEVTHQCRIVRCHRLVQEYMRACLGEQRRSERQNAVGTLLQGRVRILETTTDWQSARWEVEPIEAMARLFDERSHPMALPLLNSAGFFWKSIAEWARADSLYRRALVLAEKDPNDPTAPRVMSNFAILLQETGKLTEAESLIRKALATDERLYGPEHADLATHLHTLASVLLQTNRLPDAEPLARRALAIDEKAFGTDDPRIAIRLSTLAQILKTTNRVPEAESLMRRALAIDEKFFGPQHQKVAIRLNNLAMLLKDTGRLSEAEPMLRRALVIDEKTFGPEHPSLATLLNNLAQLLQATRRSQEAETILRRALAVDEKSFGPDHFKVAAQLNTLAHLLWTMGKRAEAIPMMRRAIAIDEHTFGPQHSAVATGLNNFAMLIKDMGALQEAEPMMRRALGIREQSFGPNHPDVAVCLHNLALVLKDTGRETEAESLMRRAVEILLKYFCDNRCKHKDSDAIIRNYQYLLAAMGFSRQQIDDRLNEIGRPFNLQF